MTDYYGFRLTSERTPGILVEHGVGAPGAPDHDWLRANVQAIADVWALSIVEFVAGGNMVSQEDFDAYKTDVRNSFEAVKAVLASLASGQARDDTRDAALAQQIKDTEVKAVVEAILSVKPEALKPAP